MQTVKVLPKGQITIPKDVRKHMGIKVGDTLVIEEADDKVVLKKGKTIFDYAGTLPDIGMSINEMREKAIEEAAKDRA
ncbi:MAG: AbrB/MazE/SpoVT family DNA-binding domain-containing protein [Planctomycetota bacterium]